jgi:excinuclease ABC subunit A
MNKPDVDSIEGLSPAISIEQKSTSKNPRSTVGTVTEIYDYLRLLYARIGIAYCPEHNLPIIAQSPEKITEKIEEEFSGMITILAPLVRKKKGTYQQLFKDLNKEGFARVRVNGEIYRTEDEIVLERYKMHTIDLVVDRLDSSDHSRIVEAVEQATTRSDGLVIVVGEEGTDHLYSAKMACPICGMTFEELQPRMFSFNSPFGACPECKGLGIRMDFDSELIIPDKEKSIAEGAIATYRNFLDGYRSQLVGAVAEHFGFTVHTPIKDLTLKQFDVLMSGSPEQINFHMSYKQGQGTWSHKCTW